jgi:hypothetical protein
VKLSLPLAVLIGLTVAGILVGAAIIFSSTRARFSQTGAKTEPRATFQQEGPTAPASQTTAGEAPAATGPRPQFTSQLAVQVATLARECWRGKDAEGTMKGAVDLHFDADGNLRSHGAKEALPKPDMQTLGAPQLLLGGHGNVLTCIDKKLGKLQVPAPGVDTHFDVPFRLP